MEVCRVCGVEEGVGGGGLVASWRRAEDRTEGFRLGAILGRILYLGMMEEGVASPGCGDTLIHIHSPLHMPCTLHSTAHSSCSPKCGLANSIDTSLFLVSIKQQNITGE